MADAFQRHCASQEENRQADGEYPAQLFEDAAEAARFAAASAALVAATVAFFCADESGGPAFCAAGLS